MLNVVARTIVLAEYFRRIHRSAMFAFLAFEATLLSLAGDDDANDAVSSDHSNDEIQTEVIRHSPPTSAGNRISR